MRKIFTTYHFLLAINSLLLILLVNGCSAVDMEEGSSTSIPVEGSEVLCISTRAEGGTAAETAMRTLRLIVFSEDDGSMILNQQFLTKDAAASIPDKSLTYFVQIGGVYRIATLIPKGTIRVILIANELETLNGTYTLDGIRKTLIKYYDTYQKDGALDIRLEAAPDASSNIGYLPMYAESRKLYYPDWNGADKVIPIDLIRTLAKVSLQITGIDLPAGMEKGTLIIKSASIINATKHSLWGDSISAYTGTPANTVTKEFSQKVTNATGSAINTSDKLEFYIPGHAVSDDDLIHKGYTYIQINATFTTDGGTTMNSTYEIPLGNGVEARKYKLEDMVASDLKVSRNKIYQVEAMVTSKGVLSVVSINAKIQDWSAENINADIDPPCLNVSSIDWEYNDGGTNRIYFWSNMDKEKINLAPTVEIVSGGSTTETPIEDVFEELLFTPDALPTNFHFYGGVDESLYFHTNGYFDLVKSAAYTGKGEVVKIKFTAGKVTRRISVTMP